MSNLKIGIVGHGYVGKAVDNGFSKNVIKKIIDPLLGTNIDELLIFDPDLIFICVPTPMSQDGNIDSSIIISVLNEITKMNLKSLIVIKSSVTPSELKKCQNKIKNLLYNPEFLTEQNANFDFLNPDMLIIGGPNKESEILKKYYELHSSCIECPIHLTDIYTASIVKYTLNTFLATKVLFMNEIHNIFINSDAMSDWDDFTKIIKDDSRIGSSHLQVPGSDGKFGFGGACFPKDIRAFTKYADSEGRAMNLLKEVIKLNNTIRSQYKDLDDREKEQNIKFTD